MKYAKIKKINRATGKQDGWRWEFRTYNKTKKRYEPVRVDSIPMHIRNSTNEEEVKEYCNSQSAVEQAAKYRAQLRSEWRKKYHDYEKLIEDFATYQKERAPNSWENDVYYLEKYAFHYFLDVKQTATYLQWSYHYEEFRAWLKSVKPLKWNREKLSLNTQNKIIKALNVFLEKVGRDNAEAILKCPQYKRSEMVQVSASDLLEPDEIKKIQSELLEIRKDSHDFFTLLANTGMRENEALGLCVGFIFEGKIKGKKLDKLHNQLAVCGLENYHGYICLESQPALPRLRTDKRFKDRFGVTWDTGSVPRKPLKLRRKIEAENYRFIPIFDKKTWNIIAERWNQQHDILEEKTHGKESRDYLLFDGLTTSMFYGDLQKAFDKAKLRFRSPHKLRHTFLTWFYDKTDENRFLAKKVAGHNEERSVQVYSHMNEQIGREQERKEQSKRKMKLIS